MTKTLGRHRPQRAYNLCSFVQGGMCLMDLTWVIHPHQSCRFRDSPFARTYGYVWLSCRVLYIVCGVGVSPGYAVVDDESRQSYELLAMWKLDEHNSIWIVESNPRNHHPISWKRNKHVVPLVYSFWQSCRHLAMVGGKQQCYSWRSTIQFLSVIEMSNGCVSGPISSLRL